MIKRFLSMFNSHYWCSRLLLLSTLESKLLRCKLLEMLLDDACSEKSTLPMSLSMLLHYLQTSTLPSDSSVKQNKSLYCFIADFNISSPTNKLNWYDHLCCVRMDERDGESGMSFFNFCGCWCSVMKRWWQVTHNYLAQIYTRIKTQTPSFCCQHLFPRSPTLYHHGSL